MTTFTKEQLAEIKASSASEFVYGRFRASLGDLAAFALSLMERAETAEADYSRVLGEHGLTIKEKGSAIARAEMADAEIETLRAIALTAEHLCKYDGSKAMTAKGHFYDAAKAYEFSERLHELLAEWRKGQKEGRW